MSSSADSPFSPGIFPSLYEQHNIPLAGLYRQLLFLDRGSYGANDPAVYDTGAVSIGYQDPVDVRARRRSAKIGRPPGGNGYRRRPGQKSRDTHAPHCRKPKTNIYP